MNPVFQMNNLGETSNTSLSTSMNFSTTTATTAINSNNRTLMIDDDQLIEVDFMNTNFSNPIYEYKKIIDKNAEEAENLLENT